MSLWILARLLKSSRSEMRKPDVFGVKAHAIFHPQRSSSRSVPEPPHLERTREQDAADVESGRRSLDHAALLISARRPQTTDRTVAHRRHRRDDAELDLILPDRLHGRDRQLSVGLNAFHLPKSRSQARAAIAGSTCVLSTSTPPRRPCGRSRTESLCAARARTSARSAGSSRPSRCWRRRR